MENNVQKFCVDQLKCLKVIVYKDKAEIHRVINVELKQGQNELILTNLSNSIFYDSLKVNISNGQASLIEVSPCTDKNYEESDQDEEEREESIETENSKTENSSEPNQETIPQDSNRKMVKAKSKDLLQAHLEAQEKKLKKYIEISNSWFNYIKFTQFADGLSHSTHGRNNFQVNKFRKFVKSAEKSMKDTLKEVTENNLSRDIKLKISTSKEKTNAELIVSYLVGDVSWSPYYDIRTFSKNDRENEAIVNLFYYGIILNQTGEDWKETHVTLSTGTPLITDQMPDITTQKLVATRSKHSKNNGKSKLKLAEGGYRLDEFLRSREKQELDNLPQTDICSTFFMDTTGDNNELESGLSTIYSKRDVDHQTNNNHYVENKVTIGNFEIPSNYFHQAVPKKQQNAFKKIKITNRFQFPMLSGEASLFLDKNYSGKIMLPFLVENGEHVIDLGIDPRIKIEYKVKKYIGNQLAEDNNHNGYKTSCFGSLFRKKKQNKYKMQFEQKTQITNLSRSKVNLTILDNIPFGDKKNDVKVKLLSPKIKNHSDQVEFNEDLNLIQFKLQLEPCQDEANINNKEDDKLLVQHDKKEAIVKYVVTYSSNTHLNII